MAGKRRSVSLIDLLQVNSDLSPANLSASAQCSDGSFRNSEESVSKDVSESKLTLLWALKNLPEKKFFLLHVHQQISMDPSSSGLEQSEIDAIQESELNISYERLDKYCDICKDEGDIERDVEISWILADNVEEGIVELIYDNNIKKLVMGATTDSHYTEKAEYVSRHVPHWCKIWLVCNGDLIQTRTGRFDLVDSSNFSSEPSSSFDFALIPYEEEPQRAQHDDTESPEDSQLDILYSEEITRRIDAEEELNKAKAEIEDMEMIQKELTEQLYIEQKQRDEAVMTTEELLRFGLLQLSVSNEPPSSFICPITHEVMEDPLIAADGSTYEAVAIREWLNGHQTSPVTNVRLDHKNLVPNRALRSAIQEWHQRNS